jgi:hypothetical protein
MVEWFVVVEWFVMQHPHTFPDLSSGMEPMDKACFELLLVIIAFHFMPFGKQGIRRDLFEVT